MAQELLPSAQMQRRKLLILENDRRLRQELEQIFSDLDVTSTETSEEALVLVRRLAPDVLLFYLGAARGRALCPGRAPRACARPTEPGPAAPDPQPLARHQDHCHDRARCARAGGG